MTGSGVRLNQAHLSSACGMAIVLKNGGSLECINFCFGHLTVSTYALCLKGSLERKPEYDIDHFV